MISYNGVELEIVDFIKHEREMVYDPTGKDLLYVRHLIGVVCIYARDGWPHGTEVLTLSPAAASDAYAPPTLPGVVTPVPAAVPAVNLRRNRMPDRFRVGQVASLTDIELRTRLYQPRGKLVMLVDDLTGTTVTWLESPSPGAITDVTGGPYVHAVDVVENVGEPNSLGIYFEVSTCLPPCHTGEDQTILSHRWRMTHTNDENYYLTRIINGTVVFNQAMLLRLGLQPDWFRNQLFHPIPLGYKRGIPEVSMNDDNVLNYTITDTDTAITFDPGDTGATNIEINESFVYKAPFGQIEDRLKDIARFR